MIYALTLIFLQFPVDVSHGSMDVVELAGMIAKIVIPFTILLFFGNYLLKSFPAKSKHRSGNYERRAQVPAAEPQAAAKTDQPAPVQTIECGYCHGRIKASSEKCPNCGAVVAD